MPNRPNMPNRPKRLDKPSEGKGLKEIVGVDREQKQGRFVLSED